jgi:predicted dehydrogenase
MSHSSLTQSKKLALFGCGIWGQKILAELVSLGASVDVIDADPKVENAALALGAVGFLAQGSDLSNYDGVILATSSSTHRSLLERILPFDIPVFVEKPLTTNLHDAMALQRFNTGRLFLMHIWTYHPGIMMLRDITHSSELGKLLALHSTRANWTSPRKDADTVWNLAPHDITIARMILGHIPEPAYAVAERHNGTIRSFTALLGKDPFYHFNVSNRYEYKVREVRLNFERGVAVLENDEAGHIKVVHGDAACAADDTRIELRKYSCATALHLELKDFLNYLNGGPAPQCTFQDGLDVVQTLHKLINLAEERR